MENYIICTRKSRKLNAKKADNSFFAWYRDPASGAKLPENRINIDTLYHRINGGLKVHVTSLSEAHRIAKEALEKGLVFNYQKIEKPRLIAYVEAFWTYDTSDYVKRKLMEGSSITKMQVHKHLKVFDRYCKPYLDSAMYLDDFRVAHMEKIKAAMFDKGLSGSAINQAIESLRTPLNEAYRQEIIRENIGSRLKNVKRNDKEKGLLTPEESKAVIKYLMSSTEKGNYSRAKYLTVAIMFYSGMRPAEVITLTPSCIEIRDEFNSYIHVKHSFNRMDGIKATKNGKERTATIPTELAREILDYAGQDCDPEGLIFFAMIDNSKPMDDGFIREGFYDALEKNGIKKAEREKRNITLYSLRHGFNTAMVDSGLGEAEIMAVTGHSSAAMTQHYLHETEKKLQKQGKYREMAIPYISEGEGA